MTALDKIDQSAWWQQRLEFEGGGYASRLPRR